MTIGSLLACIWSKLLNKYLHFTFYIFIAYMNYVKTISTELFSTSSQKTKKILLNMFFFGSIQHVLSNMLKFKRVRLNLCGEYII